MIPSNKKYTSIEALSQKQNHLISNVCSLRVCPSFTLVSEWRSATNIAASFPVASFWNGSTAHMRLPRWRDEPVDLIPVMTFCIEEITG